MRIKQPGWLPHGHEADLANRILSGNGARLYSHLYFRANRSNGQLELRYDDVASALKRKKRSIVRDFAELREKGVCRVDSAVNQHTQVRIEICDRFWPFAKSGSENSSAEVQYASDIRTLLQARTCVECNFGASDERFALDLFAQGIPIEQIDRAIRLGCARKTTSLLNGTDDEPILRLSYFRDLIEEAGETDPRYWDRSVDLQLKQMENRWRKKREGALPNPAPARRKGEKETR